MSECSMANRKMTLSKTKLAQSVSSSISSGALSLGVAAALLLSSSNASALGLGSLEVTSNLDQPFTGTIELKVAPGDDLDTLTAVIASREDFESLGIDYPSYLKDFSLLLDTLGNDRMLRVTSNNVIIKEPFIHFLVRVESSGGSFLREYTALIDPPVYAAESPAFVAEPREVGTDQNYRTDSAEAPEVEESSIDDNVSSDDQEVDTEQTPTVLASGSDQTDGARYGPVESGSSLSVIAQELQSQFPDLSIYQIMKVMFEENQDAFIDGNINGLIQGSILNIGDLDTIRAADVEESRAFYRNQIAEWNPGLLQPSDDDSLNVGDDTYSSEDDSSTASSSSEFGESDDLDNFRVGAATESDDFLSSGQGDSSEGEILALRDQVTTLQVSLASSQEENIELSDRIQALETQLEDLNRLAELSIDSPDGKALEDALRQQNDALDELSDGTGSVAENLVDDLDEGFDDVSSGIEEFVSDGGGAIEGLVDDGSEAIEGLVDDGSEVIDGLVDGIDGGIDDLGDSVEEGVSDAIDGLVTDTEAEEAPPVVSTNKPVVTTTPDQSILDKAKSAIFDGGLWKVLAGLGGLLALGAGAIFLRRRRADEEFEVSMLSIESNSHSVGHSATTAHASSMTASHTASIASDDATNADKETSFLTVYSDSDAVVQADEVDPVAEADVYIAYGRDEQAEEVLLDGVVSHPDRVDIKQKLLSLYHKGQNTEGFERVAEELYSQRATLDDDVWQQVCDMGKEVSPGNPLFDASGPGLDAALEASSEIVAAEQGADAETGSDEVEELIDDSVLEDAEQLGGSLTEKAADVNEALTIGEDADSDLDALVDDPSIQLVDFDEGAGEIAGLDEVEIDALDFGEDTPESLDISNADSDVAEISLGEDDKPLEFAANDSGDDGEELVREVSDLEIDPDYDEARTQYELAKVFVDLGDEDGARKILVELVDNKENSADVLSDSKALLDSINS